ncbi:MAG TPA: peptidoglycan-binding domain-containing protein [Acidimicrobiales bacterium]|nr:peptidoglycan-binding domain-containing protein [Acidimicrobiales bacterium]
MAGLQPNSQGPEVEALQKALVAQGYFVGAIDGVFGLKTLAAVVYFQSVNSLALDGVVGPQTLELLGIGDHDGAIEMTLPAPDAIKGESYEVIVNASVNKIVRIVVWFTAGAHQEHAETTVDVNAGSPAHITLTVPSAVRQQEGEVHVHATAYPPSGTDVLDTKASSFWVNL